MKRRPCSAHVHESAQPFSSKMHRLMEVFEKGLVADAVRDAIRLGAPGFDAIKQLILCRIERRPSRLDVTAYPYLPKPNVGLTRAADYAALMPGRAA
jgi:hypothetical protein